MAPAALELFSDGRVIARYFGSPDAVDVTVKATGWAQADESVWREHSRSAPARWARIATPRTELRRVIESLPAGARWWCSPGTGLAHWTFGEAAEVEKVRKLAEAAGGSLVLMAAPDDVKNEVGAWGTPPPTLDVMRRLKDAFDPHHVLNPGRFVV